MGSFEPERAERCELVEMLTTTGMVFLAMAANDGGRAASRVARLAAPASGAIATEENMRPHRQYLNRASEIRFARLIRPFAFSDFGATSIH
jgi:hypothetical protein